MKFSGWAALVIVLGLTACGGDAPPPVVYRPLDYSYLPPITLKVATVNVVNNYVPDPSAATLIGAAPEPPANAVTDLLDRRLVPNGRPGIATATIEAASIDQAGGNLVGTLTVRLNVASADNRSTGYTEATVSHSETAPDPDSSPDAMRTALYDMTRSLTSDLNDRLQYQIIHSLRSWMADAPDAGAAPLTAGGSAGGGIVATPLTGPTPPVAPGPVTPMPVAPVPGAPPALLPTGPANPPLPAGSLPLGVLPVPANGNSQ